jgi:CheY-like chemotaxis protein
VPDRILVVDDEVPLLALLQKILGKAGYVVECAASGEEGLRRLKTEGFDLAIADLRMPQMSGVEFVKQAKVLHPALPCVVLTGYGSEELEATARQAGACAFLPKPIDNAELTRVVKQVLARP